MSPSVKRGRLGSVTAAGDGGRPAVRRRSRQASCRREPAAASRADRPGAQHVNRGRAEPGQNDGDWTMLASTALRRRRHGAGRLGMGHWGRRWDALADQTGSRRTFQRVMAHDARMTRDTSRAGNVLTRDRWRSWTTRLRPRSVTPMTLCRHVHCDPALSPAETALQPGKVDGRVGGGCLCLCCRYTRVWVVCVGVVCGPCGRRFGSSLTARKSEHAAGLTSAGTVEEGGVVYDKD